MNQKLTDMLIRHEGMRLFPYLDTRGKVTIGCGRNLSDVGITKAEAMYLLSRDILAATQSAQSFSWFWDLTDPRQDVVIAMIFNLGLRGFSTFKKLIAALAMKDYEKAASEMLASDWALQVGMRAVEMANIMRTGAY